MEVGEILGDGPGTDLADVVGAKVKRLEFGEVLGDGPGPGVADVIVG